MDSPMPILLNLLYLAALAVFSPWLLYKSVTTGKYRRGLWAKFTGDLALAPGSAPRVWFHGVSVGEIHLLRQVVAAFRQRHPDWDCVISTTTDTGFDEARKHFADLAVFFWPFDFSWAVRRVLAAVQPSLVVLAESETWPNFLQAARQQNVPVALINARMSPRSLRRYQRLGRLLALPVAGIDLVAAQNEDYAAAFQALGVPAAQVRTTGSVKYDGVSGQRDHPRTRALTHLLGIAADDLVWVAGSTQSPEEEIVVGIYRQLRPTHPNLRLLLVPRQKDRFDEVATLLQRSGLPFVRRSALTAAPPPDAIILVDTIGELGALWGRADVAYVGGSLDGRRGGQNMIEPAASGAAVTFGPHVWNFRQDAARLVAATAALQVADAAELARVTARLCGAAAERARLGENARRLVAQQQGATARTIDLLDDLLARTHGERQAA